MDGREQMIPAADIKTEIPSPLPTSDMPSVEENSEEGYGFFRDTWWIGQLPVKEAESTVREEIDLIHLIDQLASDPDEFELLASSIEMQDLDLLPDPLRGAALECGLARFLVDEDIPPLDGLEIGVAGLACALSAIGCLTAASCRWHIGARSWSDCPVVFFAAPAWRVELLAGLASSEGCGLGSDRGMLTVYGPSISETHNLAKRILSERRRFRKVPEHWRSRPKPPGSGHSQLALFSG
jgi:hypothetical protein